MDCIPLHKRPTAVASMVRQIASLMEPFAKEIGVTLDVVIDNVPDQTGIDEDKIAWTLGTLIGNALRHVPKGPLFHPGGQIVVRAAASGTGETMIEVTDNGPGIPADKLALLLQPAPYQRRLGYALILAREIVEAHGGRLEITSSQEPFVHMTTVRLILPPAVVALTQTSVQ